MAAAASEQAKPAFFLTALDPRARIRGSRDGVGAQGAWAGVARPLIGNLTTVTSSLRGFVTLLVGLRLAERAEAETAESTDDAFLVWEQMAAFARRLMHDHRDFPGLRRVARRAAEATDRRVRLSARPEHQILGNQRTYGLLGNYTAPARVSGLVRSGSPVRLAPEAAAFVDRAYLPRLAAAWGRDCRGLVRALGDASVLYDISDNQRLAAIASLFGDALDADEAEFYRSHLVRGGPQDPTGGRQARLAELVEAYLGEAGVLSQKLFAVLAAAGDDRGWTDVGGLLRRVAAGESLLAPATALFGYVLGQHGRRVDDVARNVRDRWGDRLTSVHPDATTVLSQGHWPTIGDALASGDYRTAVEALVARNTAVMADRGGALPWVEITDQAYLMVRFRGEAAELPDGETARSLWTYPYFVPSLRSILVSLHKGRS